MAALSERISNVISFRISRNYTRFQDNRDANFDSLVVTPRHLKKMASHFRRLNRINIYITKTASSAAPCINRWIIDKKVNVVR